MVHSDIKIKNSHDAVPVHVCLGKAVKCICFICSPADIVWTYPSLQTDFPCCQFSESN